MSVKHIDNVLTNAESGIEGISRQRERDRITAEGFMLLLTSSTTATFCCCCCSLIITTTATFIPTNF